MWLHVQIHKKEAQASSFNGDMHNRRGPDLLWLFFVYNLKHPHIIATGFCRNILLSVSLEHTRITIIIHMMMQTKHAMKNNETSKDHGEH